MGISQQQALDCFASDDLIGIGMEADSVRRSLHPDGIVTYAVDHTITSMKGHAALVEQLGPAVAEGVTTLRIEHLAGETMRCSEFEVLLGSIREQSVSARFQSLNASDLESMAVMSDIPLAELLTRLRGAGLDAIEDGRAGVSPERWLEVHAAAHRVGLRSRASISFGAATDTEELVRHLMALRGLQEDGGGFTAVSLYASMSGGDRGEFEKPTAVEYLRTLAVARIVLDNIPNIESSGVIEGLKVMQMALRFGANDGGTIATSAKASFTEAELRRVIRDAGFAPVERDILYQTMFLNN